MKPPPTTASRRQLLAALGAAPILVHASLQDPDARDDEPRELPPLAATLILVRHTEKANDDPRDPNLSALGRARAEALATMFGAAGVTGLVHTEYRRTRDTLAPLAKALDLESETIGGRDAAKLIERLSKAKADETIVVAGHSNTIPAIAWSFGVELRDLFVPESRHELPYGYLPHDAYDRVHVLTPGPKRVRLLELRSSADVD